MARREAIVLALGGACLGAQASAQDARDAEAPPDLEFLEYLGSWQGEDDEWFVIEQFEKDEAEQRAPKDDTEERPRKPEPNDDESGK
jgi:hypothetical protein